MKEGEGTHHSGNFTLSLFVFLSGLFARICTDLTNALGQGWRQDPCTVHSSPAWLLLLDTVFCKRLFRTVPQ